MRERRKSPRYPVNLHAYLPEFHLWGYTSNISLDGCYVVVSPSISEGFITDFVLELPVVGAICLKGYVQRKGQHESGLGLQFIEVHLESAQSDYYSLYAQFLKQISRLEKVREHYMDLIQQGRLKLVTMPGGQT
ncbi:MAG: hypothetical protein GWP10_01585 [Nitrospiraceae bacterium]|nr:hypothetical protein [Nitrospiraceae bacterium]